MTPVDEQGRGPGRIVRRAAGRIGELWRESSTADLDIDDADTTLLRRQLIQDKAFLREIYGDWYRLINEASTSPGPLLEVGSGGGFLKTAVDRAITSDILMIDGVDLVLDASILPFGNASLRGVALTNVMHHLPDVESFLSEACRCIKPGGSIVMIEPWVTIWSRFVYRTFHHEPFDPAASSWSFAPGHPLSSANGALPWIIFKRDQQAFAEKFPDLVLESVRPFMAFTYLISGGLSFKSLMPAATYPVYRWIDEHLTRILPESSMFALIVLRRKT
jgi:SAM-dependent methyltransferase